MRSPSPPSFARRWVISADEQQGHPGRRGHAQGMPPQADHDACGGGEFGSPDEPVAGPRDTEVRGGLPHFGLAGQLANRGEQAGLGQQQRDGDERGNLLARPRLRPSSSPLTWSFPLAFTILNRAYAGTCGHVGEPPPPAAPKFRFASEPAVSLRSGWSGHCLQIVERVFTTLRLRKLKTSVMSKYPGPRSPSGGPAADRRAPGGLAREPVPDTRARHWPGRTRAGAAAGTWAPQPPPRDPGAR